MQGIFDTYDETEHKGLLTHFSIITCLVYYYIYIGSPTHTTCSFLAFFNNYFTLQINIYGTLFYTLVYS